MTDWPVKTLGEVALVGAGNSAPQDKELFKGGMHRFVRTSDVGQVRVGRLGKSADLLNDAGAEGLREFRAGVTLMPKSGASTFLNHRVQLTKPCFVSSHLAVVDPNPKVMDDTFIFYFLQTVRSQDLIQDQSYPSLNLPAISGIKVLVPPLEEQKRIVALLDAATARVTELTACYEKARTHANNLFASALRDALAPSDSWPVKRLGDLCLFVRGPFGGSLKKSVFVSTGHAVYEQQHAISGKFDKFRYFVSASKFQEMKRFEVFPGDILMSCSGTIGKTVIVPVGAPAGIINQALLKLSCSEKLNNQYLCVWMRSIYFQEAVFASVVGVALQNVASVAILKNIPISLPPMEQQKQIVAQLDLMRSKTSEMVSAYDAKLQAAKDLRQSILEAAFAGDL